MYIMYICMNFIHVCHFRQLFGQYLDFPIAFYDHSQLLNVSMYVCMHILYCMYIGNTYIVII